MSILRKGVFVILLLGVFSPALLAQRLITSDDAIAIAMKNNFDILIARNDADMAKINNTSGNAGMLPSVFVDGSDRYTLNNSLIKQSPDITIHNSNAGTNSINTGVQLNWTLYDGGKMFVTKNKLNEIEALGEIQFREQVLQTVYNVVLSYYNVVKLKQQLVSFYKVISLNQERVTILKTSFDAGSSAKNNLLQAKIDLNVSKENAMTQQSAIIAAKRILNQVLSLNIDSIAYDVVDSIPLIYKPNQTELQSKIYTKNAGLLSIQKDIDIAKLSIKEIKATRLPQIDFNTGYSLQYSGNNFGTTISNRTYGPHIGASISIPIYLGGNTSRQIANSEIHLQSAQFNLENNKIQVNTQLQNALTDFETQQNLLSIEQENSLLVKENLDIALQRLRFGQTTALEVRQAQQSYEDSMTRLVNFKYNLKVAETKLRQLVADL